MPTGAQRPCAVCGGVLQLHSSPAELGASSRLAEVAICPLGPVRWGKGANVCGIQRCPSNFSGGIRRVLGYEPFPCAYEACAGRAQGRPSIQTNSRIFCALRGMLFGISYLAGLLGLKE